MKIVVLANCPPFEYLGSGYVIKNFTDGLKEEHKVLFYDPRDYVIFNFMGNRAQDYRNAIGKLWLTIKILFREKVDMIEFWGGDSWLAAFYTSIFYKDIMTVHHSNGPETKYNSMMRALTPQSYKWYHINWNRYFDLSFSRVYGIVTVSEDDADWAKDYYKNSRVKNIEPCLPEMFLNIPLNEDRAKVIGYTGSWILRKGTEVIKSDMSRILKENPDVKFKIIGSAKDFDVSAHFPEEVLAQIEIVPFIKDRKEIIELYKSISIMIMPSLAESFGLIMPEAMACGCALVVTKVGYGYSLKNGEEAIIIEKNTKGELYNGVNKLLSDDSLRKQIVRAGYAKAQGLKWESARQELSDTYKQWYQQFNQ